MDDWPWVLVCLVCLLLGAAAATGTLVLVPSTHRWLVRMTSRFCRCYCTCHCRHAEMAEKVAGTGEAGDSYSEIDNSKTRTFAKPKVFLNSNGTSKNQVGEPIARYQRQPYEAVDFKRFSNHAYCLVEPGTNKRLPVRPVNKTPEEIRSDTENVYFVLEPGSDKVVMVNACAPMYVPEKPAKNHIYFILEPNAIEDTGTTEPYAVNDLSTEHTYFILENMAGNQLY